MKSRRPRGLWLLLRSQPELGSVRREEPIDAVPNVDWLERSFGIRARSECSDVVSVYREERTRRPLAGLVGQRFRSARTNRNVPTTMNTTKSAPMMRRFVVASSSTTGDVEP